MGICTSCYSGATATTTATVKLILSDGQLREFSSPVKVFLVAPPLDLDSDLSSFICNADEMDFDHHLTAMSGEEELRLGQLYFQLPASWLNRRLAAEDMAALAVKAGTALMVSGGGKVRCGCCVKRVDPLVFCEEEEEVVSSSWGRVGGGGGDVRNHRDHRGDGGGGRRGGKGRMVTRLERITEE